MRTGSDHKFKYPVLYKYTKKKHAESMVSEGVFRIGTLYEYKKSEQKEIGDDGEGTRNFNLPDDPSLRAAAIEEIIAKFPHLIDIRNNPDLDKIFNADMPVSVTEISPDFYILSLTSKFDLEVMRKFNYDACVEIRNPGEFFLALCKGMERFAHAGALRECIYENRWRNHDKHSNIPPELMKPIEFAHQKEVRGLWAPYEHFVCNHDVALNYKIITVPETRKYCRRIV